MGYLQRSYRHMRDRQRVKERWIDRQRVEKKRERQIEKKREIDGQIDKERWIDRQRDRQVIGMWKRESTRERESATDRKIQIDKQGEGMGYLQRAIR